MANKCNDCVCTCKRCVTTDHDVQLHVEIENLKQKLKERESHIVSMETNFLNETDKSKKEEDLTLQEELSTWQDKYKRLYEAHRRVQRVNQGLEDKLLKLVDVCETDKNALTKDVATLSHKLAEANYAIKKLTEDNERYKSDVSLAIQFLQCKQSNFVQHKFDSLPTEIQSQVSSYMSHKKKPEERKAQQPEAKSIKVPIPTFPPTAMVYSVPKSPNPEKKLIETSNNENVPVDIVSAAIMAKVLEERQRERSSVKHCDTCTCSKHLKIIYEVTQHSIGVQTEDFAASEGGADLTTNCAKLSRIITETTIPLTAINQNIVKVQPNNFLANSNNCSNTSTPSITRTTTPPKSNPFNSNNHVISNEINVVPNVLLKKDQTQKNVLLNNGTPNVSPTICSTNNQGSSQNQRRVAEWINNNIEENDEETNSCSSRMEIKQEKIDKEKYAEMEENVRRFLFGESNFLKTVELGKKKYESYHETKINIAETDI